MAIENPSHIIGFLLHTHIYTQNYLIGTVIKWIFLFNLVSSTTLLSLVCAVTLNHLAGRKVGGEFGLHSAIAPRPTMPVTALVLAIAGYLLG